MNPERVQVSDREVDLVRARVADLDLPGLVDLHTHFMPRQVLDKVWAYFDQVGPLTGRPWPITYRTAEEDRLATLADFGVLAFTSLLYPHKPGMATWLNEWATEFAHRTPGCLHTATFYPEEGVDAYVAEAISSGARVFKAHVQVGDYDPNDPLLDKTWGHLQASATPVIIHSGHGPAPGRFTGPAGMARLLERYPHLRLIVAHMGLPDYADFLDLTERYDGVRLDTTMAFTPFTETAHPFPRDLVPRLRDLGDRILFGSDFPNMPYPYLDAVDAVLSLDLGADWNRAVLHGNAASLFALPTTTEGGRRG